MLEQPLDFICSSPNKMRILRAMVHVTQPVSGRQAVRLAGTSLKGSQSLDELADAGLILRRESTGQNLYSFNFENYLAGPLAALFQAEEARTKSLLQDLRAALSDIAGVITGGVFGSAAVGSARPGSDLDVFVVVKTQRAVPKATDALLEQAPRLFARYGVRLSPVVVTSERWRAQLEDDGSLATIASRDAKTFIGKW